MFPLIFNKLQHFVYVGGKEIHRCNADIAHTEYRLIIRVQEMTTHEQYCYRSEEEEATDEEHPCLFPRPVFMMKPRCQKTEHEIHRKQDYHTRHEVFDRGQQCQESPYGAYYKCPYIIHPYLFLCKDKGTIYKSRFIR